ncbi:hypothetical protein Tco_0782985, partial [Tanacetum coccineum]
MWTATSLTIPMGYNDIMFTHDPKSAKVSKGFESPNLQGRVNSLGSSILVDTLPWTNVDPFLPSSKLSTWLVWEMFASVEHILMALIEVEGYDENWGSIVGLISTGMKASFHPSSLYWANLSIVSRLLRSQCPSRWCSRHDRRIFELEAISQDHDEGLFRSFPVERIRQGNK